MEAKDSITVFGNTPLRDRPDLGLLGIEEVDKGICEDTFENRAIIRNNELKYRALYNDDLTVTGLIEAYTLETSAAQSNSRVAKRSPLLADHRDMNSDYLTGTDLLFNVQAVEMVPPWVLMTTRNHLDYLARRAAHPEKTSKAKRINPPGRCVYIKQDGVRCVMWHTGHVDNGNMCSLHLGYTGGKVPLAVEAARNRIHQAAPAAVDTVVDLMENAASEQVRLKAATEVLDRSNIRAGSDVTVEVKLDDRPPLEIMQERLTKLKEDAKKLALHTAERLALEEANTVDAEIVEDE